ncbi:MAG: tRNA (cytidine(34)-2'-O)-methyltransferase [Oligoflexia bacterium]|nr:tRNA (cytidine(34)-2'-O)-methyltransferase [Oligoflexia bacterium]
MKLENPNFNIALIEPEIPNNTGSIGRTCVGTACRLHLIGKLGFDIDDRAVKRAGLDYWENLDLVQHKDHSEMLKHVHDPKRVFYFSKKASRTLFDVKYEKGDWFVFGKETVGLNDALLREVEGQTLRIPQWGPIRSLNLSNAAAIVIYEAMRQVIASSK